MASATIRTSDSTAAIAWSDSLIMTKPCSLSSMMFILAKSSGQNVTARPRLLAVMTPIAAPSASCRLYTIWPCHPHRHFIVVCLGCMRVPSHQTPTPCSFPDFRVTSGLPRTREHLHTTESLQTEKVSFAFFAESSPSSLSLRLLSSILSASFQIIPKHHHRLKHTIISSSSPLRSLRIWGHQHMVLLGSLPETYLTEGSRLRCNCRKMINWLQIYISAREKRHIISFTTTKAKEGSRLLYLAPSLQSPRT